MIQLSNLQSMTPETPAKTVGAGAIDGGFADLLAGELEGDAAAGGKTLPVALPVGGKTLPGALPGSVAIGSLNDLPTVPPVQAPAELQSAAAPDAAAIKTTAIDAIVIPSIRQAVGNPASTLADEAEPNTEAPRPETLPMVAAKAIASELKSRIRADRPAANEVAEKSAGSEVTEAGESETEDSAVVRPAMIAEGAASLLVAALAASPEQAEPVAANVALPDEQAAAEHNAEAVRPEAKRADSRMQTAFQTAVADQTNEAGENVAPKEGARQGMERDSSAQGDGARGQRGAPELRFELSRSSAERAATVSAGQANQIRMPLAAASQIVVPDAAAMSGQIADASALPGATNQSSTSFASQQGLRPHDFSTLVDRLVEARETARGGSVNIAVMHADFGEVSLRFRQDASGLSVSMSNNDPEFARAVSAASQADGTQMGDNSGQGTRRDDSMQNGNSSSRTGTGGDWGQSSGDANMNGGGRQQMQDDARGDQVAGQSRAAAGEERSGRDGIYA